MMRSNPLATAELLGHYRKSAVVTPSDTEDLPGGIARGLYIGTAGNLSFLDAEGKEVTAFPVAVGPFPFMVMRVKATGTTASNILAGY